MSQYSLIKLVIKIPKKKMGTAFAVPTIKIDGENYFKEKLYACAYCFRTALVKQVTSNPMAVLNLFQLRLNLHAMLGAVLAAAGKGASRRQVQRTRDFAFQRLNLFARLEVYLKYSTHKCLGIRMLAAFCNTSVLQPFYNIT